MHKTGIGCRFPTGEEDNCCGLLALTSSLSAANQVPLGFSVAVSVRVGNALGSGDVVQAKTSCITAVLCAGQPRSLQRGIKALAAAGSVLIPIPTLR